MDPSRASESLSLSTTADGTPPALARSTSSSLALMISSDFCRRRSAAGQQGGVLGPGRRQCQGTAGPFGPLA